MSAVVIGSILLIAIIIVVVIVLIIIIVYKMKNKTGGSTGIFDSILSGGSSNRYVPCSSPPCYYTGPIFQASGSNKITLANARGIASSVNFTFPTTAKGDIPVPSFIPKDNIRFYNRGGNIELDPLIVSADGAPQIPGLPSGGHASKQDYNNGFVGLTNKAGPVQGYIEMYWY
jgi:hypothetical protein